MRKNKILLAALVLCSLISAFGGAKNVLAAGWTGTGTNTSYSGPGGNCGTTVGTGYGWAVSCTGGGFAWVYYSTNTTSGDIYMPYPKGLSDDAPANTMNEPAKIDSQCANNGNGGGFWAFGHRATNVSYYGVKTIDVTSDGEQTGAISDDSTISTKFTGLWGPAAYGVSGNYNSSGSPSQTLGSYTAQRFGTESTVLANYNTYLASIGQSSVNSLPDGLYAFCYWDGMNQHTLTAQPVGTNGNDLTIMSSRTVNGGHGTKTTIMRPGEPEGYDFLGWATSRDNARNGVYFTETNKDAAYYVSGGGKPKEYYNVASLTQDETIYAVYGKEKRTLTLKSVDVNGNSLSGVSGLGNQSTTVDYGDYAEVTRGTNSHYKFLGFKVATGASATVSANWVSKYSTKNTSGRCNSSILRADCPTYFVNSLIESGTVYAVYESLARTLTVMADSHSSIRVTRTSSPAGESIGELTGAIRDHQDGAVTTTVYVGDVLTAQMDRDACYHWDAYNGTNYAKHLIGPTGGNLEVRGGTTGTTKEIASAVFGSYTVNSDVTVQAGTAINSHTMYEYGYDIDTGGALSGGDSSTSGSGCPTLSLDRQLVSGYKFLGWQSNAGQRSTDGMITNTDASRSPSEPYLTSKIEGDGTTTTPVYYKGSTPYNIFKTINYLFKQGTSDEYDGASKAYYAYYAKQYTLTTSVDVCSTITVNRIASRYAALGTLSSGAKIYVGDVLRVTFGKKDSCGCFDLRIHTINGNNNYGLGTYDYAVGGDTAITANSHLRQYTLTKRQATGTGVSVRRTQSTYTGNGVVAYRVADGATTTLRSNAGTGELSNGTAIYCGDKLDTSFTLNSNYSWGEYGHSERGWHFKGIGVDEWGPNNDLNQRRDFSNHTVDADVTAETLAAADGGTVVRNEFQGRARVYEKGNEMRSNSTGWTETSKSASLNDIQCLNYATDGGCKVDFRLDLRNVHGTGSTAYSIEKSKNGGAWGNVKTGSYKNTAEENIFDKTEVLYPGESMCYQVVFRPFGAYGNDTVVLARSCATAQVSEFEGRTTVTSGSGTTTNGYIKDTNAVRRVQNVNCVATGCSVSITHDLRRAKGIGWTDYEVARISNYPSEVPLATLASGREDFANGNERREYTDNLTLYPGVVVCEKLSFRAENNYVTPGARQTITTCASAVGSAQPDNPEDHPTDTITPKEPNDPSPADPDGPISDVAGGDDAFLNIKVKNNSVTKYNNYSKVVYAKPGDSLTYRATYNPVLQYTYNLAPEKLQIDGGDVYPTSGKNSNLLIWNMFNTYKNVGSNAGRGLKNWNNDFSVYSTNFKAGQFQEVYSHTNGDTSFQSHTNDYVAQQSEVGTSLVEFARTNYDLANKSTVKTTPAQVRFSDNGDTYHYNKANVMTTGLSRNAFVRIPYNFVTAPEVKTDESVTVQAGGSMEVAYDVKIDGKANCETTNDCGAYTTKADDVKHEIIVYDPTQTGTGKGGGTMPGGRDADVCSGYFGLANNEVNCGYTNIKTEDLSAGQHNISATIYAQDKPAGSQICVAVAMYPASSGADTNWNNKNYDGTWRISASKCYTIAKKPSFQAWGGNVYAAGKINTSVSEKRHAAGYNDGDYTVANGSGRKFVFGSWGELGVIAGGVINNFGSAATMGYAANNNGTLVPHQTNGAVAGTNPGGYQTNGNAGICVRSLLTFANMNATGTCVAGSNDNATIGNVGATGTSTHAANDKSAILAKFKDVEMENLAGGELGSFLNDVAGVHYYYSDGSAVLGANVLKKGADAATIFLKVKGDLVIAGDIKYDSGWASSGGYGKISDIPKLVAYATGNIKIACSVSEVDAMLVADGAVDTCYDGGDDRNAAAYSHQLIVNGAIIASKLELKRTYGAASGSNSIVPAEIINYDPTLYLWGSSQADMTKTGGLGVTYTMELSPRYGE